MVQRTIWTEVRDPQVFEKALRLARGTYQEGLLRGWESLSGSTLRGEARKWGARYAKSRQALLNRLTDHDVPWTERTAGHQARILVIG